MRAAHGIQWLGVGILALLAIGAAGPPLALAAQKEVTLQDAIKARTEVTLLMEDVADLPADLRRPLRRIIADADAQQLAGNLLLKKESYAEAREAFEKAAALCRQAINGQKLLDQLAAARRKAALARLLAEATVPPEKLKAAGRLELEAAGLAEAGELEQAMAQFAAAAKACEALAPARPVAGSGFPPATLDDAVAARAAMVAARKPVDGLLPAEPRAEAPKRGSLPDLLARAAAAQAAASDALDHRDYTPARGLFQAAEKLFRDAAVLAARRADVLAARKAAEDAMKRALDDLKSEAPPASFEHGKQALADGVKALDEGDDAAASHLFADAKEFFQARPGQAPPVGELEKTEKAWAVALATVDAAALARLAPAEWSAASKIADEARARAATGEAKRAVELYGKAADALKQAVAAADARKQEARATQLLDQAEAAVAKQNRSAAEKLLAEAERLLPKDPRITSLRKRIAEFPGPTGEITLDLGGDVKLELVLIPAGSFLMGDEKGEPDEKPVHKVTISKPFYMGKHEVTQEQWKAVTEHNPSQFEAPKSPVENVSWNDCQTFLRALNEKLKGRNFRLPTEAQWRYACRAGSRTQYSFGDDPAALGEHAWFRGNSAKTTHPVGQKKPNPWGLVDMHGNVWEWCDDGFAAYRDADQTDPAGPLVSEHRMLCGGSWNNEARHLRSAFRNGGATTSRGPDVGFRLVLIP